MVQLDSQTVAQRSSWLSAASARDWAFVIGLAAPVAVYALGQKLQRVATLAPRPPWPALASLFVSDVAQLLALGLAAIGLLTVATRPFARTLVRVGLVLLLGVYLGLLLAAHGFFMSTGTALDWPMLYFSLTHLSDTAKVIASAGSSGRVLFFGAALTATGGLPWLLGQLPRRTEVPTRASDRATFGLLCAAAALSCFSVAKDWDRHGGELLREPLANVLQTLGVNAALSDAAYAHRAREWPLGPRRVEPRAPPFRGKNVVVLLLESVGAWATSLYGGPFQTTPKLRELAEKSIVAERMYALVPHTSKALTAILCGVDPRPGVGATEALVGGIQSTCLPSLLAAQGYDTMFMQAATREFESRPALVKNLGFQQFLSGDEMNAKGLKPANYFGYEDRILVEPIRSYAEGHQGASQPFFLTVLTNTPHHDYRVPSTYGREHFSDEPVKNRFLNAVRYDDFVLGEIMDAFAAAGLLERTVFVILGDHGEGFGQHGRYAHDDVIYEEGLRIPLLIYEPGGAREPRRWPGVYSEIDIAPTVLDLLGLTPLEGRYRGASIFAERGPRVAYAACYNEGKCVARIAGDEKVIHHFGRMPDELFDLAADPSERHNLAKTRAATVKAAVRDVLDWYGTVRAVYRKVEGSGAEQFVRREPPAAIAHPLRIKFGDYVELLGWEATKDTLEPGGWVNVTWYFHVLKALPADVKLFVHGYDGARRLSWDHTPVDRRYPESRWRAGDYISDVHRIYLEPSWRSDKASVRMGFWNRTSAQRLSVEPHVEGDAPAVLELPVRRRH